MVTVGMSVVLVVGSAPRSGAGASSVAGALAAIDVNGLAGDEGGAFQEQDRVYDVSDFSHASDWMQVCKEFVSFGSMHRRLDDAGSNGVDPDALLCVLDRQRLRGGAQSAFGQRGEDRRNDAVRVVDEAGRDLHDVTRTLLQHFGRDPFGEPKETSEIDRKDRSVISFGIVDERLGDEDARVV